MCGRYSIKSAERYLTYGTYTLPVTVYSFMQRQETLSSTSAPCLLVDIVFGFQALQQRLEERLVRFRGSADGLPMRACVSHS
jgi:hypothetical protein